jgi:hypothetical protein
MIATTSVPSADRRAPLGAAAMGSHEVPGDQGTAMVAGETAIRQARRSALPRIQGARAGMGPAQAITTRTVKECKS